jgi:hypothetical protein
MNGKDSGSFPTAGTVKRPLSSRRCSTCIGSAAPARLPGTVRKKKQKKGKEKRKRKKERWKIEKNYLFFRNYYLQFILTIILLDNKNKR